MDKLDQRKALLAELIKLEEQIVKETALFTRGDKVTLKYDADLGVVTVENVVWDRLSRTVLYVLGREGKNERIYKLNMTPQYEAWLIPVKEEHTA